MHAANPHEVALLQTYEAWSKDTKSPAKEYALGVHLCCNAEDNVADTFRPEFALWAMNTYAQNAAMWSALVWRGWFVWWTRAEQLHQWATHQQINASGAAKALVACANANAWYKAWHWALEEEPSHTGHYLVPAQERLAQAYTWLAQEPPAFQAMRRDALSQEPWYETVQAVAKHTLQV